MVLKFIFTCYRSQKVHPGGARLGRGHRLGVFGHTHGHGGQVHPNGRTLPTGRPEASADQQNPV